MPRLFLIALILFLAHHAQTQGLDSLVAADTVIRPVIEKRFSIADTTQITQKHFAEDQLQKFRSELDYKEPPTVAESLWERFKRWLSYLIERLFRGATTTNLGRLIMYIVGGVLLVWIILTLLKINAFKVFFSGAEIDQPTGYQVLDENIHEMDFDELIKESVAKKDFRIATRLVFLYALKILTDQHLINWSPGKTNHEYVNELEREDLKPSFNDLSIYFDYAWYGNFEVSSEKFKNTQATFDLLRKQVADE